jgi:hypothetical protein
MRAHIGQDVPSRKHDDAMESAPSPADTKAHGDNPHSSDSFPVIRHCRCHHGNGLSRKDGTQGVVYLSKRDFSPSMMRLFAL